MFYSVSWFSGEKHDHLKLFDGQFRQNLLNCKINVIILMSDGCFLGVMCIKPIRV